mgnify:CR=1 FL=1
MAPPANPHAKPRKAAAAAAAVSVVDISRERQDSAMGRQSQQRVNNTEKAFRLASATKKRKGGQLTLTGENAFEAEKDCPVCHARSIQIFMPTHRVPKRGHHTLCAKNKTTQGNGVMTQQNVATSVEEKRLKVPHTAPLVDAEKCSGRFSTAMAAGTFFQPKMAAKPKPIMTTMEETTTAEPIDLVKPLRNS